MKHFPRIHPLLFLVSSFTYSYLFSAVIASPFEIFRSFFIFLALFIISSYPIFYLISDWDWTFILISVLILTFLSPFTFFMVSALFFFFCFALSFVFFRLLKPRIAQVHIAQVHIGLILSCSGIFLIILDLFLFRSAGMGVPASYLKTLVDRKSASIPMSSSQPDKPDIYYIVLDAYGREDILKEYYGFNNSYFLSQLADRGFVLPEQNTSNYPKTALSVASTLNMNYINEIAPDLIDFRYWWLMSPFIDKSEVRLSLEELGYQTVSVATDWGITDNKTTDFYLHPRLFVLNDFEGYLLGSTPLEYLGKYLSKYTIVPSYSGHRAQTNYNFTALEEIPMIPGPKFVFVHIDSPHPPFVFDKNGGAINPQTNFSFNDANDFSFSREVYRNGYIDQLQYINGQLLEAVDNIISGSATPPIIILQGDHGPGMFTDFRSSENSCLRERFSPFAAYYLPGANPNIIPENITPVNLFRIIFNEYFDAQLPLLENRQLFPTDALRIYSVEDVTSKMNQACVIK